MGQAIRLCGDLPSLSRGAAQAASMPMRGRWRAAAPAGRRPAPASPGSAGAWTWRRALRFIDGPDELHLRVVSRDEIGKAAGLREKP